MAYIKKWNGSSWVDTGIKKWNGSSWVDAYTYKWNGSKWIQIYPDTSVTQNFGWESGGNFRSWRQSGYETTTSTTTFKQGPYSSYTAAYGYSDLSSASIPGSGNITAVHAVNVKTTRGGAGSYNNDKTIYFWRSANAPNAVPRLLGSSFTAIAKGVGKNVGFDTTMNCNTHTLDWTNQVGGGKYLWIYTSDANHYLSLGPIFSLNMDYTYIAVAALFVDEGQAVAFNMSENDYSMEGGGQVYHKMPIYKDEVDLTLTEIMERREQGIVEDIDNTTVNYAAEIMPWFREREVFEEDGKTKFKIEAKHMRMEDEAQYSLDKENWFTLYGTNKGNDYVEATMPEDFNKYSDYIYVRILDKEKDMVMTETICNPKIYVPDMTKGIVLPGKEIDIDALLGDDNPYKE